MMKVLIVIPTWKRAKILDKIDLALLKQEVDVLWIGDAEDYVFRTGKYINVDKNFVESLNVGLRYAIRNNYDWVIFFDDDVIPNENYMQNFIERVEHSDFVCVGGALNSSGNETEKPCIHFDGSTSGKQWMFYPKDMTEVGCLMGCNWAVRLDVVRKLGIQFDEGLSRVGYRSETDFQMFLKKAGYRIYLDPKLWVIHLEEKTGSFSAYEDNNYWRGHDHARFSIKHFGLLRSFIGILFTNRSSPRPIWQGVPAALIGKYDLNWYRGYLDYLVSLR